MSGMSPSHSWFTTDRQNPAPSRQSQTESPYHSDSSWSVKMEFSSTQKNFYLLNHVFFCSNFYYTFLRNSYYPCCQIASFCFHISSPLSHFLIFSLYILGERISLIIMRFSFKIAAVYILPLHFFHSVFISSPFFLFQVVFWLSFHFSILSYHLIFIMFCLQISFFYRILHECT